MDANHSICYEPRFDQELNGIESNVTRADEFMRGIEWALKRNPAGGKLIGNDIYSRLMSEIGRAHV